MAHPAQPEKVVVMAMQAPAADIVLAHTFGPFGFTEPERAQIAATTATGLYRLD